MYEQSIYTLKKEGKIKSNREQRRGVQVNW